MSQDLEQLLQEALDQGQVHDEGPTNPMLRSLLEQTSPEGDAARQMVVIDRALRFDLPEPAHASRAADILAHLDDELPDIGDPTAAPIFEDQDSNVVRLSSSTSDGARPHVRSSPGRWRAISMFAAAAVAGLAMTGGLLSYQRDTAEEPAMMSTSMAEEESTPVGAEHAPAPAATAAPAAPAEPETTGSDEPADEFWVPQERAVGRGSTTTQVADDSATSTNLAPQAMRRVRGPDVDFDDRLDNTATGGRARSLPGSAAGGMAARAGMLSWDPSMEGEDETRRVVRCFPSGFPNGRGMVQVTTIAVRGVVTGVQIAEASEEEEACVFEIFEGDAQATRRELRRIRR